MSLINSRKERIRFLKFSFVGVTGTIVDFGIMNLMRLVFNLPLVWSQGISFSCAVINNFIWNRYWTYPESRKKDAPKQLIQFSLISLIGLVIRTPLVPWLDKIILNFLNSLNLSLPIQNFVVSQNLALAISIGIVTLWNYFANRYWTFNNISSSDKRVKTKPEKSKSLD